MSRKVPHGTERALKDWVHRQPDLVVQVYRRQVRETKGCQSVACTIRDAQGDAEEVQGLATLHGNAPRSKRSVRLRELVLFKANHLGKGGCGVACGIQARFINNEPGS
jgi:hypothetical protein